MGEPDPNRSVLDRLRVPVTAERPTQLLGVLWATGGILAAFWGLFAVAADGWPAGVVGVGVFAMVLGTVLLLLDRPSLSVLTAAALTLLGSVAICQILWWSGSGRTGAPAVLFIYVSVYAFVALDQLRWPVLGASAAAHVGTLLAAGAERAVVEVAMIWGAAVVGGMITRQAVQFSRSAAAENERLVEQLRQTDELKTAFLRSAGHDLATPAGLIAGLADTVVARDEQLEPHERRELIDRVAANARRLQHDLQDLLHLGELGEGHLEPVREEVELAGIVDRAIRRAGLPEGQVALGPFAVDTVVVDGPKVEHAIANLLGNAAKYAGDAGPIEVSVDATNEHVVVHVDDRGPGIAADQLEAVFEPFTRADDQSRSGSGVGLSIVRAFARLHGGDSWAQPREGGGLRMSFSVSASPPASEDAADA